MKRFRKYDDPVLDALLQCVQLNDLANVIDAYLTQSWCAKCARFVPKITGCLACNCQTNNGWSARKTWKLAGSCSVKAWDIKFKVPRETLGISTRAFCNDCTLQHDNDIEVMHEIQKSGVCLAYHNFLQAPNRLELQNLLLFPERFPLQFPQDTKLELVWENGSLQISGNCAFSF